MDKINLNLKYFQVDLYVSRDLDSRLNERELAAVQEWLDSSKEFHFMRDHPQHGTTILGGVWGCKMTETVRNQWKNTWKKAFEDKIVWTDRSAFQPDQQFLNR